MRMNNPKVLFCSHCQPVELVLLSNGRKKINKKRKELYRYRRRPTVVALTTDILKQWLGYGYLVNATRPLQIAPTNYTNDLILFRYAILITPAMKCMCVNHNKKKRNPM